MPSTRKTTKGPGASQEGPRKAPSGAEKRRRAAQRAAELARAPGLDGGLADELGLTPPPADDLQLQLWGARCAATLTYLVLTRPGSLKPAQFATAQRFLATLGMLFPRSEMVARLERARKRRERAAEDKETQPRAGLPPGPGSRRRSSAAAAPAAAPPAAEPTTE